ncbi:hypothetical protein [Paenibacillus solani]|uniref:hypothetical protein n=1 Tax=Paenibacillus solani TaxID=1705565 RepID=UPI001A94B58E|nr:hypothetical protein [Paenibacillus solani]
MASIQTSYIPLSYLTFFDLTHLLYALHPQMPKAIPKEILEKRRISRCFSKENVMDLLV